MTASTPGRASASPKSVVACFTPYFAAASRVGSIVRPTTEATSIPPIALMASRCFSPNAPAPARTTFISSSPQDDMAQRRVRCRNVIVAMDFLDLVAQRPAHDQPHHQLDAFGSGLAHVFDMRNLRELLRLRAKPVEEPLVPRCVDETRA